jgi:acyl-CoA thioester hydrolase
MTDQPKLEDFTFRTYDKLRYGDTDRQGHVNNAVFATFLESGRVELIEGRSWRDGTASFVIARLELDYVAEVLWPGTVEIGTSVKKIGRSSLALTQAVFQSGRLVATAETVMVYVDNTTHRSTPLPEGARVELAPSQSGL